MTKNRGMIFTGITALLTAVTLAVLLKGMPVSQLTAAVAGAKLRWLAGGFSLMLLYVALEGVCIKITMETMEERPSLWNCVRYAFVGFYFSGITPSASGGQPAQVYCMGKDRFSLPKSTLCLLLISSVYQIGMLVYGAGVYAAQHSFLNEAVSQVKKLLFLGAGLNVLLVGGILALMFSPALVERTALFCVRLAGRFRRLRPKTAAMESRVRALTEDYAAGAEHIKRNPALVAGLFVITLLRLTILYLMPFFVALAFGVSDQTAFHMIGLQAMLTLAVSSLPFPGSVGISEGTSLLLFGMMFSSGLLLPAVLLVRGISFYAVLGTSGLVLLSSPLFPNKGKQPQLM
ncbi:lysylphosphatidylglycerol synthase transmembrane domain-containing protein [Bacilliculturomica massiliensis]|uniref:lysylphosphatidylglycerol synthase transmembrane domain-containing protein n=1 Tax=Bacilliculturomica massiliensis TaxID=1917867 RepID=UPI0010323E2A|nr:lysylphosphatidylglycerol synthase transmembrane domain-containing protein [Bacilliculturomica massiliensis]